MTLKLSVLSPLLCLAATLLISACGNKGDLYLLPDEITQQELLRLEQALESEAVPSDGVAPAVEDEDVEEVQKKDPSKNTSSR